MRWWGFHSSIGRFSIDDEDNVYDTVVIYFFLTVSDGNRGLGYVVESGFQIDSVVFGSMFAWDGCEVGDHGISNA